jgi:maltooligosyltrehalose trehalohydrolase
MVAAPAAPWQRRFAFGAEIAPHGVHFRVWADRRALVEVQLETGTCTALQAEGNGCFSGLVKDIGAGALYRFRLDGGDAFPDPASRYQPSGPHGPSQVIDPTTFVWSDAAWRGPDLAGSVLYELHVGTFTPEGTWASAVDKLVHLAELGVTCIEVMPVAEFPGTFGWGYDGVDWFAPYHHYGTPEELRLFVDRAHGLGLAVVLDVVYNHLGPDGNYVEQYSAGWFTDRYRNDWGTSLDYETTPYVRQYIVANACYWIAEFHFDGLRLDATQDIRDASELHICAELAAAAREIARPRKVLLIAENEPQHPELVRTRAQGGWDLDLLWNDDYHHTAFVALTGRREAYFRDYGGTPQELISAIRWGYLFQGQWYSWQQLTRGRPGRDIAPRHFVHFLQNHDQIANQGRGWQIGRMTSPCQLRAMTALTLLGPQTPMLFQGQEFGATAPFHYFADHGDELAAQVQQGRVRFLAQFPRSARPDMLALVPVPHSLHTFQACKLRWEERTGHRDALAFHRDLLELRRTDPAFAAQPRVEGAVLTTHALVLRFAATGDDLTERLLLVNLGDDRELAIAPEPLLAPPFGCGWQLLWSSEDVRYGGDGTPEPDTGTGWRLQARSTVVLRPVKVEPTRSQARDRPEESATTVQGGVP